MVIDVCTYNGEKELWDIHYNVLKDYVDEFIVLEFDKTFSGEKRSVCFEPPKNNEKEIRHYVHDERLYEKYRELAESSPNTAGASHWKREFMQKESIKDTLGHLKDDDIVFIGDVDEVWSPPTLNWLGPIKLKLKVYTYYLNNRSSEEFWGTLKAPYGVIKNQVLNHLRTNAPRSDKYGGWHFTSMGGAENLMKKLTDSYTQESYATPTVLENVSYNVEHNKDFLGRNFTYHVDESGWPEYLKRESLKYRGLCK